jgi:aerobic carbon-monoxide dehydrogenase medium subunit
VKPAPFAYAEPRTLDEATAMLAECEGEALVLAGGQSLIPLMNLRLARPAYLVDVNRIPELGGIRRDNGRLVLGATARHFEVAASPVVRLLAPLLAEAASLIGHPQIRHRGTAGGSLAEADPAGQLPAAFLALEGEVVAHSVRGCRSIAAQDLFVSFLTTALEPDEIISEIRVPAAGPRVGSAFLKVTRRKGDFAVVGVAAQIVLAEEGVIAEARIALGAMGHTPLRATEAEEMLSRTSPGDLDLREVGLRAAQAGEPATDAHATAAYRRHAAAVLTERAVALAIRRAREERR